MITLENGKPIDEAKGEAPRAYDDVIAPSVGVNRDITIKQPIGVCGIITPWNFPVAIIKRKVSAPIAAGCTVVIKLDYETPFTAIALAKLAKIAGIPDANRITQTIYSTLSPTSVCYFPTIIFITTLPQANIVDMNPSQGLASDTLVRTTRGDKRVGDIQVGDILYDPENRPSPVIGITPPATGNLKKITYTEFDSKEKTSFTCAPDHRLTLTTTGINPSIRSTRNAVVWFTRCDRKLLVKEACDLHRDKSSPLSDSSSMELDNATADRFAAVRKSLDSIDCDCGGLRKVQKGFNTQERAQRAFKNLQSDVHHLIDPLIVSDGEGFSVTVREHERLCSKAVKLDRLKVYRAPLAFDPSTVSADPEALPLDPTFLGLWLGDGSSDRTRIVAAATDPETRVWLETYVDRLNSSRPQDAPKLRLTKKLNSAAGTKMTNGYVLNSDVFAYGISSGKGRSSNPVLDGLRQLGLLGNKKAGIPDAYMTADLDTRLAVIAGLIDSDGWYDKSQNRYKFKQMTDGHKKIVTDLMKLAISCGISVSDVRETMRTNPFRAEGPPAPEYIIYLTKGSEKFQKYLLLPRKKMNLEHTYINHDARPFTVSDAPAGEYRAIQVRGGRFQLANRLVVCDCQLNSWFDSPAQDETDTQTLSSQQVPSISAPLAPTVFESPPSSSKAASTTQTVQKPQSKSSSKRPPKASTSKSYQKSTPASTKKSSSPRKQLQPKPGLAAQCTQLDLRDCHEGDILRSLGELARCRMAERLNAAMMLLGDEERGLIPSDDEDIPDSVMPDVSDEPNQPILPPKNSPSKSRSATPRLSATKRPRSGTKITTPRSTSFATIRPDVTITTTETTIIESENQPERIEQVPPMPTTCPMPVLPPEPAITGPAPIEITDYVPRKRKIIVVDEPLIPKY
ncbi:hypothetical protein V1517DRAFT_340797 [Lipomyces orientalis]|uniref:Uncharacterized protein n=1 Tax=Lipomyces orientalis TaxID=1233043 RepID=A0ACC3TI36_9ASCO